MKPLIFLLLVIQASIHAAEIYPEDKIAPSISASLVKTKKMVVGMGRATGERFLPVYEIELRTFGKGGRITLVVGYVRVPVEGEKKLKAHEEIEVYVEPGTHSVKVVTGESFYKRWIHNAGDTKGIVIAAIEGPRRGVGDFSGMTAFFSTLQFVNKSDLDSLFGNVKLR